MSGITGIFRRDGKDVDLEDIKKMNDKIAHRGPDGSRVWCEGPVALGHQMLHTTPESLHETLPFEDEESGLVITADARIDNRKDLAPQLGIEDNKYVSDSYFILKAYDKWGEKTPEKLLGDFAFAIWDKNSGKLFCARDHMGVKPFYYFLSEDHFFFSTEIKALNCFKEIPYALNPIMAAFYLIPNTDETQMTFYENVLRLPAAHFFTINSSNQIINKYWQLDPDLKIRMDSNDDYVNKFRVLFNEAVKCRLRSFFPIGFELSGGLDSSSIVNIAKNNLGNKNLLNTYSIITKDFPESDESFYIKKMVESGGIKSNLLLADHISPLNESEKISWHLEQPIHSPNVALFWCLYKKMQNQKIRVLFRGYDGDSVLSQGQFYFKELFLNFEWKKLSNEIKCYSEHRDTNFFDVLINKAIFPIFPRYIKKLWRQFNGIRAEGDFIIHNEELNRLLDLNKIYKPYDRSHVNPNKAKEFHYRLAVLGSHQFAFEFIDKITNAFSMEPRYPFFDKRLLEFCYAIPNEQKFKFGWDRMILRRSMSDLPKEVKWRPQKKFLGPLFERNFLLLEQKLLDEFIFEKENVYGTYINPQCVKKMYDRYKSKNEYYGVADVRDIWKLVTLMKWLEETKLVMKPIENV